MVSYKVVYNPTLARSLSPIVNLQAQTLYNGNAGHWVRLILRSRLRSGSGAFAPPQGRFRLLVRLGLPLGPVGSGQEPPPTGFWLGFGLPGAGARLATSPNTFADPVGFFG